jgi:Tfp pilus assembly protein PilF
MRKVLLAVGPWLFAVGLSSSLIAQTTLIDQGRAALNKNDAERAAELLEKAVAATPNNAEAHFFLGEAYGSMAQKASLFKQPGLAMKTRDEFERAVQLDPNLLDARMGLIDFYLLAPGFMGGDEQKAFAQAAEIRKRDPVMGHRAFGRIYHRQKKPDLARKEYTDSVKEQPSSPKTHYFLGAFLFTNDKNYNAAMQEFESAIKLDAAYMPSWFQLGHVAALSGSNMEPRRRGASQVSGVHAGTG